MFHTPSRRRLAFASFQDKRSLTSPASLSGACPILPFQKVRFIIMSNHENLYRTAVLRHKPTDEGVRTEVLVEPSHMLGENEEHVKLKLIRILEEDIVENHFSELAFLIRPF